MWVKYLLTLLLTLIVEGGVAYLVGLRKRRQLLAVVTINVITHVILNYLILVLSYLGLNVPFMLVIFLETLVVVVEWRLLVYVFHSPSRRLFVTSLLSNTASFLTGLLLFWT
jgi:hypothetical protein